MCQLNLFGVAIYNPETTALEAKNPNLIEVNEPFSLSTKPIEGIDDFLQNLSKEEVESLFSIEKTFKYSK